MIPTWTLTETAVIRLKLNTPIVLTQQFWGEDTASTVLFAWHTAVENERVIQSLIEQRCSRGNLFARTHTKPAARDAVIRKR